MSTPATAAGRTRLLKKILADAGYEATVRSAPAHHQSQTSDIFGAGDPVAVAAYLDGYLGDDADAVPCGPYNDDAIANGDGDGDGGFVSVRWLA